ncbi:MAG: glycosyltransferase [Caldilineaceae bacterium]
MGAGLATALYQRLVMPQLDGVVGVSQTTLTTVRSFYNLTVPCQTIPNGIAVQEEVALSRSLLRQRLGVAQDAPVLLTVGSLSTEKRIDRLLRVTGEVRKSVPDLQLWIVGDGPERERLEAQAAQAGLTNIVHFLGVQEDVASVHGLGGSLSVNQ